MGVTATERPRPSRWPSRPGPGIPDNRRQSGDPGTVATDLDGGHGAMRGAVRGAIPLALAGLFANAANVGVTVIIARELSTRAYGAVAQLLALYFVVSIPGSALLVGVVRRVSSWRLRGELDRIGPWVRRVRRAGLLFVAAVAVLGLAGRGLIARELSLPGPGGVAEMLTAGAAWSVLCIDRALLQCRGLYRALAANVVVEGASRTLMTIGMVVAGFDQAGVSLGQMAAVACCVGHARWVLARRETTAPSPVPALSSVPAPSLVTAPSLVPATAAAPPPAAVIDEPALPPRRLTIEVGSALAALAFLGLLQNIDVLVLGRLRPGESGAYAAISVASKVLVFGAMVLAGFLLPEAANRRQRGQHALHQLGATMAILAVPAGLLLGVALVAPTTLLRLAFGPRLTGASAGLLPLAAAMTCLGATVLFTHYLLAVGSRQVLIVLGAATLVALPMLVAAHGHAAPTARADLFVQALLTVATGLMVLSSARRVARP
jgi:O-antigen/teichoic acid export membrane protein